MNDALPAILELRTNIVTPQNIKLRQKMADTVIEIAAMVQDWPLLDEAIRLKIADQRRFIDQHWDPQHNPHIGRNSEWVAPDRPIPSAEEVDRRLVSRWRAGMRDEDAYHAEIARAARVAAGLEESDRVKRDKEAERRRTEARLRAVPATGERYRLIEASVTALMDEPAGSIDIIVTDPPYPVEHLPLFGDLARGAAHVLKPGGLLLCMSGQSWVPRVYAELSSAGLSYVWTLNYLTPAENVQVFPRRVLTSWKPILMYCQGEYQGEWYSDLVRPEADDKEHHYWGQAVSGFRDLMERFLLPGQTVCDPFLGGGTTAVVALELGASFIGFDVDPLALLTTRAHGSPTHWTRSAPPHRRPEPRQHAPAPPYVQHP